MAGERRHTKKGWPPFRDPFWDDNPKDKDNPKGGPRYWPPDFDLSVSAEQAAYFETDEWRKLADAYLSAMKEGR